MRNYKEEMNTFLNDDIDKISFFQSELYRIGCRNVDFKLDSKIPFPAHRLQWKIEAHLFLKDVFDQVDEMEVPLGINESYFYLVWLLREKYNLNKEYAEFIASHNSADVFFLQSWAKYKQIYKFDKDCLEMLKDTEYDKVPIIAFEKLPYNAFWIDNKFSVGEDEYVGCHVAVSKRKMTFVSDVSEENYIGFQFVKNNHDMDMRYAYIPLNEGDKPLEEYFTNIDAVGIELIRQALPLVLYLCSENKDLEVVKYVTKNEIEKNKKVIRSGCTNNKVGYKIGATFKKTKTIYRYETKKESSQGSSKSPHFRRGHYHHYWTGKKDGSEERKMILLFVEPTFINAEEKKKNVVPTIHKVKQ